MLKVLPVVLKNKTKLNRSLEFLMNIYVLAFSRDRRIKKCLCTDQLSTQTLSKKLFLSFHGISDVPSSLIGPGTFRHCGRSLSLSSEGTVLPLPTQMPRASDAQEFGSQV